MRSEAAVSDDGAMSDDRSAGKGVPRRRPLSRPRLPPGPLRDMKEFLYQLYVEAGTPTLDKITSLIAEDDSLAGAPERDTVRRCLSSASVPANEHDVTAISTVLARVARRDAHDTANQVRRLWVQARLVVPLGIPIHDVSDPFDYEVHRPLDISVHSAGQDARPSLDAKSVPLLPAYVRRAHDDQLNQVVRQVTQPGATVSRIVVLVGGSSTGKSRACWEALHAFPEGWRVWDPRTIDQLLAGLESGQTVSSYGNRRAVLGTHTVLWLNELQRYLLPPDEALGERVAAGLRDLVGDSERAPVLVLGSIWPDPDRWATLIREPAFGQRDVHEQARKLLSSVSIRVPDEIGSALDAAVKAAETDPYWRLALQYDSNRPIQYMAGAAYLRSRYDDGTPSERAVLEAAADARRVGGPIQFPLEFLERAARDYLSDVEWRRRPPSQRSVWVREVIQGPVTGLTVGGHGIDGPFREPRLHQEAGNEGEGQAYELADYLEQYLIIGRKFCQPGDSLWYAAENLDDAQVIVSVGKSAERRGRWRPAAVLYLRAARLGNSDAWIYLGSLLGRTGEIDKAKRAYLLAAKAGNTDAWFELGALLDEAGDENGAWEAYTHAAESGDSRGGIMLEGIALMYEFSFGDDEEESAAVSEQVANVLGDNAVFTRADTDYDTLVQELAQRFTRDQEQPWMQQMRHEYETSRNAIEALLETARAKLGVGDAEGGRRAALQALAAGSSGAIEILADLYFQEDDHDSADRILHYGIKADGTPEQPWGHSTSS